MFCWLSQILQIVPVKLQAWIQTVVSVEGLVSLLQLQQRTGLDEPGLERKTFCQLMVPGGSDNCPAVGHCGTQGNLVHLHGRSQQVVKSRS